MTKTLQEQEDEQGYSVDENTYFHPASGLNGLIITASSSILALDKMLGKRITNTRPFTIPAKRKTPTVQNDYSQAPAKTQRPLQVHDLNISRPSEQIQQETYPGNCSKQSPATFARKVPRILPPRNPPAQPNNSSLRSRAAQQDNRLAYNHNSRFNQPPQHNQQSTQRRQQPTFPSYQARQASSSSNDFSILDNASTSSPSRIIPALPVESNWSKRSAGNVQSPSSPESLPLSPEQLAVYDSAVRLGKSIYLTGTAGTGKSVVLKAIIKGLQQKHGIDRVAVTASTGLAACHIGGATLHSEMGIGVGDKDVNTYIDAIGKQGKIYSKIVGMQALVIDEISMINASLFDLIHDLAQRIRKREGEPFGGIQVIVCGDFYQLPPINRGSSVVSYAFQANCWRAVIQETMALTKAFRQTDQHFTSILNELKRGVVSDQTLEELQSLDRPLPSHHGIEPTELYPLRKELEAANYGKLAALSGESITYKAIDSGNEYLLKNCTAPAEITLKVDAQVMLTKNLSPALVNGSRGVVSDFRLYDDGNLYPVVTFANGKELLITPYSFTYDYHGYAAATRTQIPLILAWALSIHKSQGQTIDCLRIDLKSSFDYGHAYVALSRARSMDSLQVMNFSRKVVKAHEAVIKFYEEEDRKRKQHAK